MFPGLLYAKMIISPYAHARIISIDTSNACKIPGVRAVGGRMVKLMNSREEDLITSPVHIGLDAKVKLGCTKKGRLTAAEITFLFDGGAYSDRAVGHRIITIESK